jgi:restriction system protein
MARKKANKKLPSFDELLIPTVKALKVLGESGSVDEINTKVYEIADIADDVLQIPHGEEGTMKEVDYRLAWSRTYLKKFGLLENSSRGIWALKNAEINVTELDHLLIVRTVR